MGPHQSVDGIAKRAAAFWPALVVFAIGCMAYVGAAGIFFLKDDLAMSTLTDAAGRPSFDALVWNFLWPVSMTHDQFYRPLPILFAWFDLSVFGPDPAGFRICNIGFHALNGVLLAILLNQLTGFRRPAAGWFAGLLFALHPLHGEAVLWVTQRMVVQCATFSLLALISLESFLTRRSRVAACVCVISALAAALCKEVTVSLPAAMVVIAFTHAAPDRRTRLRRTGAALILGGALSLLILVLRRVIFGVWAGTYGKLTTEEYARHFRIFERMPQSLLDGFWAVNPLEVPDPARLAFGVAWILFLAFALWRLARACRDPAVARAMLVAAVFALASFLPTMFIFQVQPMLTHGRFLYQPLLGVVGLLMAGFASERAGRGLAAYAAPAALVVLFALAQQLNQRAWFGADSQIRTIRDGIQREAGRTAGDPVVIAYDVPTEFHGVVTLDLSLALAMRPPFTAAPIDVFPLIAGQDPPWASRAPELRAWLDARSGRPVLHLQCGENPVRVSPLIGVLDGHRGDGAPRILAPGDGRIIVHPAEFPTFVFQPTPAAASYRLRLTLPDGTAFVLDLDPARHLRRIGTRLQYDLKGGCARARVIDKNGEHEIPDPAAVWAGDVFTPPRPVTWTLEALDASGRSLGRSASRALVMFTTNLPR